MALEYNKAFVCAILDATFNRGDLDLVEQHFAADVRIVDPGFELRGPSELRNGIASLRRAFPDYHFSVEDILAENDRVALRYRGTGTHAAEFLGVPATGRRIDYTGIAILRLHDGKIAHFWAQPDQLGLLSQLRAA